MNNEKVSVCIITYNHEDFIRKCLDGVINQKVNFDYKIIIGEDNSTDKTRQICEEYANKFPNLIKYFPRDKNLGMIGNWINTIQNCKGKYIAICEGDDFWTDPLKLQKQVDVLENDSTLSGCFHNSEERYWNDYSKASQLFLNFNKAREISLKDMTGYNMVPTASVLFRAPIPEELFTNEFLNLPVGDWPLHLLNLRRGNYFYIPQVMSVRHLHSSSNWGMQDNIRNINLVLNTYEALIDSNWFSLSIIQQLKTGRDLLKNTLVVKKENKFSSIKNKFKRKLISIINKI